MIHTTPAGAGGAGEIPPELAEEVRELEWFIGSKDYSARHVNGRGHLCIELSLQGWSGLRGWHLAWRCLKMLRVVFRGKLFRVWEKVER